MRQKPSFARLDGRDARPHIWTVPSLRPSKRLAVTAVQHVKRMRGGAQGHLMRCEDGNFYVVKFRNNPQHLRVLANEMLATRLAEAAGLPVPVTEVIEASDWLIEHTPELRIQLAGQTLLCEAGLQFGSRYVVSPLEGQVFDYFPMHLLGKVRNPETFAGMLALDKWTANANGRQAAFWKKSREQKYRVSFIDQGYCFNAGEWNFPDHPLRGVFARNEVYERVAGWEAFEPWLSNIEKMDGDRIWAAAGDIPPEWYGGEWDALERLVRELIERRAMVRELIVAFRMSPRRPFPNWREEA